jgi:excinuclease ABC subunit C
MHTPLLKEIISSLPETPGIYKYFDKEGALIYIGKAKSLKKRVSSYFNKNHYENRKTAIMVSRICNIEFTLVETEIDALLLENSLIKKFQPKFNINLKDDKTYPFICVKNIEPFLNDNGDAVAKAGAAMYAEYEALNQNKQRQASDDSIVNYAY